MNKISLISLILKNFFINLELHQLNYLEWSGVIQSKLFNFIHLFISELCEYCFNKLTSICLSISVNFSAKPSAIF